MNTEWLFPIRDALCIYLAAPIILLSGLWLTVRLRVPQFTRFAEAFRSLRVNSDEARAMPSAAATMWTSAALFGAASAIGAATSIALGGPGSLVWLWLWTFLLAPLRLGEALLARTSAPGTATDVAPTSLVARLRSEASRKHVALGLALLLCVVGFAFFGGAQGDALRETTNAIVPDALVPVSIVVAVLVAAVSLLGAKRLGAIGGWIAAFCLLTIIAVALLAAFSNPARVASSFTRAINDAFEGAPTIGAFTGALASEIARSSLMNILLPAASVSGFSGVIDASSRANTRGAANAALLPTFFFALTSTVLGLAFVATGTYSQARAEVRPLDELTVYEVAFESPSQRLEADRLRTGPMRIRAGALRDVSLVFATDRGVVTNPTFTYYGEPADLAMDFENGRAVHLARYRGLALGEIPIQHAHAVLVHGEMLPKPETLLMRSLARGATHSTGAQLVFAALMLLTILGSGIVGASLSRTFESFSTNPWLGKVLSLLPALGLVLTALMQVHALVAVGEIAGALAAILVSIAVVGRSSELRKRLD